MFDNRDSRYTVSRVLQTAHRLDDDHRKQQEELAAAYAHYQRSHGAMVPYRPAVYEQESRDSSLSGAVPLDYSGSVLIPQRKYEPLPHRGFERQGLIRYNMNGRGYIALNDALAGRFDGLQNANDLAFSDRSQKKSLRLEWPNTSRGFCYAPYSRQITARDSTKMVNSITVAKLAKKIAEELQRFIELNEKVYLEDVQWKVGPGYITLYRILLVEVEHVSEGSIQPTLRVLPSWR